MEEYKKVTISFTKEQLEKLDEIMSKEQGYTRSSLVREAVDYYLGYLAQKESVSYSSGDSLERSGGLPLRKGNKRSAPRVWSGHLS